MAKAPRLKKQELAKLNTASPLFAPPQTDAEAQKNDLRAIGGAALARATDPQVQHAKRALIATRRQAQGMTGLARALTKNPDIKVEVRADIEVSQTDGRSILIKPDWALGAQVDHDRRLCGDWDEETELQLCPACAALESNTGVLYHEVGHIAFGTFEPVPDAEKADIVRRSIEERGAAAGTRAAKLIDKFEKQWGATQSMTAAHVISPFLPMLLNALEDARVNAATGKTSSGMNRIFRARTRTIMVDGIPTASGGRQFWNERSKDEQALIGCYLAASGYNALLANLDEDIQKAVSSWNMRVQLDKIVNAPSVHAVYAATFPILEELRAHGFCKRQDDPEDDTVQMVLVPGMKSDDEDDDGETLEGDKSGGGVFAPTGDDQDDSDDEPSQGGQGQGPEDDEQDDQGDQGQGSEDDSEDDDDDQDDQGEGSEDDETDDQDDQGDEPSQGGQHGSGPDDGSDDADDQGTDDLEEMLRLIQGHDDDGNVWHEAEDHDDLLAAVDAQFDSFDSPSADVLGNRVFTWNNGRPDKECSAWGAAARTYFYANAHLDVVVENKDIAKAAAHARVVFGNNAAVHKTPMQRSGQINAAHLAFVPAGMDRPFKRTRFPDGRSYAIGLTLDCSGSTGTHRNIMIRQIGLGMAQLFNGLPGVNFALFGHTADSMDAGSYKTVYQCDMHQVKSWTETWGQRQVAALQALHAGLDNLDGHTLEFMRKQVEGQRATDRIIFYLTDGEMPAANREEEGEILGRELAYCKRAGITVIGIGVNTDSPKRWGLDTIQMDDPSDLKHLIREVGKRLS